MKKILIGLMGLMGLIGMTACDKIEPGANGEYTIYAGSTATWTDGIMPATLVQRALVEKYTGPKCVNCPTADVILNQAHSHLGDQMVTVSINPRNGDGAPFDGQPDMSTDDGEQWVLHFCGNSTPALPVAFLNRDTKYEGTGTIAGIEAAIADAVAAEPTVAIDVNAATATDGKVAIDVTVGFLQDMPDALTLTLVLIEDSLVYMQAGSSDPNYAHNHMLRDVITDVWGLDIDATGTAGEARKAPFRYTLPDGVFKANSHIVAFVSDKATRKVINCAQCSIN